MPELKCTVQTCMHNQNYYCMLDQIQVGGNSAKKAEETSCDSFQEKAAGGMGDYKNAAEKAYGGSASSGCSCVDCQAVQCKYNDNCRCSAGKISVEGGNAGSSSQTECATFTC